MLTGTWLEHDFPIILFENAPTDELTNHHFSEGYVNHQPDFLGFYRVIFALSPYLSSFITGCITWCLILIKVLTGRFYKRYVRSAMSKSYLVGGFKPWIFMTFHILGIVTPTDELIFFHDGYIKPPTRLPRLVGSPSLWMMIIVACWVA